MQLSGIRKYSGTIILWIGRQGYDVKSLQNVDSKNYCEKCVAVRTTLKFWEFILTVDRRLVKSGVTVATTITPLFLHVGYM